MTTGSFACGSAAVGVLSAWKWDGELVMDEDSDRANLISHDRAGNAGTSMGFMRKETPES